MAGRPWRARSVRAWSVVVLSALAVAPIAFAADAACEAPGPIVVEVAAKADAPASRKKGGKQAPGARARVSPCTCARTRILSLLQTWWGWIWFSDGQEDPISFAERLERDLQGLKATEIRPTDVQTEEGTRKKFEAPGVTVYGGKDTRVRVYERKQPPRQRE
jgi:hypothetical protein